MADITDYDKSGYDYTKYWIGRQYEGVIEKITLERMLPETGKNLLDLGGSFGRFMDLYTPRFTNATILDYSQNALDIAAKKAQSSQIKNLRTVQGDAYQTPFSDNSFDSILLIRVLHHIEDVDKLFTEINRILTPNGTLILELANKIHLKARIRAVLRGDFGFAKDERPFAHPTTTAADAGIFYNYHPRMIEKLLTQHDMEIVKRKSVSNLRLPPGIKNKLPVSALVWLDQLIAPVFTALALGPSLWYQCQKASPPN